MAHPCRPLLDEDWFIRNSAAQTLGNRLGKKSGETGITRVPLDVHKEWCRVHSDKGPAALIEHAPLFDASQGPGFSPLVKYLVATYGMQQDVLGSLSANMHSFSWRGSRVPYYQQLEAALQDLANSQVAPPVVIWAESHALQCERMIERQQLEDEERS